ncbi:MAG: hypothetical protein IPL59_24775 [Candidatus Competibacteraceae bacterium]|nr:hypothetical protein [Candidatus Competibacteraceae bacterium]
MKIPKLKVLVEVGGVREVTVSYDADANGWTVQVNYATRTGERIEVLERQRNGARVFTALDAGWRHPADSGVSTFASSIHKLSKDRQMTANGLQLSGLMRADPGHVALYRVQIGADFAIAPAYAHLIGVDVHHDSAAWFYPGSERIH